MSDPEHPDSTGPIALRPKLIRRSEVLAAILARRELVELKAHTHGTATDLATAQPSGTVQRAEVDMASGPRRGDAKTALRQIQ